MLPKVPSDFGQHVAKSRIRFCTVSCLKLYQIWGSVLPKAVNSTSKYFTYKNIVVSDLVSAFYCFITKWSYRTTWDAG